MIFNENVLKVMRDLGLQEKINIEYSTEQNECLQEHLIIKFKNKKFSISKYNNSTEDELKSYWTKAIWCIKPSQDDIMEEYNLGLYKVVDELEKEEKAHIIDRRYTIESNKLICIAKIFLEGDDINILFEDDEVFDCSYEVSDSKDIVYLSDKYLGWIIESN